MGFVYSTGRANQIKLSNKQIGKRFKQKQCSFEGKGIYTLSKKQKNQFKINISNIAGAIKAIVKTYSIFVQKPYCEKKTDKLFHTKNQF